MRLTVVGTGSSGNCYLVEAGESVLMLDAGMRMRQIRESISKTSRIKACLITHEHQDHSRSAYPLAELGVPVYMSAGTQQAILKEHVLTRFNTVQSLRMIDLEDFIILPFATQHDAAEPLGFVVRYKPTGETLLYATDTYYLQYTFPGIHYWIVESNYIDGLIDQQVEDGDITPALRHRLLRSHMSLCRLIDALKANDLHMTRTIVLVHMSAHRSDQEYMVQSVKDESGVDNVVAASAGMVIPLDLNPF